MPLTSGTVTTDPTMSHHFRKRKVRAAAPASPRKSVVHTTVDVAAPLALVGSPAAPLDGVNLSAALTALQVSLKRDRMDSFIPPTPVASPIHSRSSKRARFDVDVLLPEIHDGDYPTTKTIASSSPPSSASASASTKTTASRVTADAYLSVNQQLQEELKNRRRVDKSDDTLRARKRRQQLSYFAITSAFHRAALEREQPLVPAQSVE